MEFRPDERFAVAERFMALRRKAHLTQFRLAGVIGVCRQSVNEIENLRVTPREATWAKFRQLEKKYIEAGKVCLPTNWPSELDFEEKAPEGDSICAFLPI